MTYDTQYAYAVVLIHSKSCCKAPNCFFLLLLANCGICRHILGHWFKMILYWLYRKDCPSPHTHIHTYHYPKRENKFKMKIANKLSLMLCGFNGIYSTFTRFSIDLRTMCEQYWLDSFFPSLSPSPINVQRVKYI